MRILALIAVLLGFLVSPAHAAKPNILFILTDDQGRGDYSAFGTKDIRTPAMDRIFKEGLTFNNFYANSCVCSPTRAALLSGCYPDRVGVPGVIREEEPDNNWGYLSPHATLLPKLLKSAGYHTAMVGKWHLGITSPNTPTERGFDQFDGFLGDMMDDYWTHLRHKQNFMRHNQETIDPKGHATDLFTDWACKYLKSRGEASTKGKPFFLYLAYNAPHDPIQPPPEWLEKVKAREPNMPANRQKLVALIEHLDSGIGKVLDTLAQTKLADNTLVIFSSDNGGILANGANNGPWRSGKQHMYEGGIRVPCAARWPGQIKPGAQTDRIALTMDWFATCLEVADAPQPTQIDAVSLLATLRGDSAADPRPALYFVRREGGIVYGGKTIEALRQGDYKIVQDNPFAPLELYNLKDDPEEKTDLAKTQKKYLAELDAKLRKQVQIGGKNPWQKPEDQ
jgi:arylsulfatase A-like enzyme